MPSGGALPAERVGLSLPGHRAVCRPLPARTKTVVNRLASPRPPGSRCRARPRRHRRTGRSWRFPALRVSVGEHRNHAEATRETRRVWSVHGAERRLYRSVLFPGSPLRQSDPGPGTERGLPVAPGEIFMEVCNTPYPCFRHHIAAYVDRPTRVSPSSCLRRCLRKCRGEPPLPWCLHAHPGAKWSTASSTVARESSRPSGASGRLRRSPCRRGR